MRKNILLAPAAALVVGAVGLILRKIQLVTVFNGMHGLAERNSAISVILAVFSIAACIACVVFSVSLMKKFRHPNPKREEVGALVKPEISYIPAALLAIGAILHMINGQYAASTVIKIIFALFALLSAAACAYIPQSIKLGKTSDAADILAVAPTLFCCLWLVCEYRQNSAEPVLIIYVYNCLALCASILASYYQAGFRYNKFKAGRAVCTSLISIFFCTLSLADAHSFAITLLLVGLICSQLFASFEILNVLKKRGSFSRTATNEE